MKPWEQMTEEEIRKIKREKCKFCRYSSSKSARSSAYNITCAYIEKTGHSRGCRPDMCDKFERRRRKKK